MKFQKSLSLNVETETKTRKFLFFVMKFCLCRDRDSSRLGNSVVVETETNWDWEILWLSRQRLNETGNFCGCWGRDQSRLNKSCQDRDFIESLVNHWYQISVYPLIAGRLSPQECSTCVQIEEGSTMPYSDITCPQCGKDTSHLTSYNT